MQEIVKFLINPLLYVWIGLLLIISFNKIKRKWLIALTVYFYIISIPFTSYVFTSVWCVGDTYSSSELPYEAVVVLTDVTDHKWYTNKNSYNIDNYYAFNGNVDRILAGISFVKSEKAHRLLYGELIVDSHNDAAVVKDFSLKQGLKSEQIHIYARVNRTLDEAKGVKTYTESNSIRKLLLVTSEIHMRRALALFKKQGLYPDAYSVNKVTSKLSLKSFIPAAGGVKSTMNCLYEAVGYLGYYFKGDI